MPYLPVADIGTMEKVVRSQYPYEGWTTVAWVFRWLVRMLGILPMLAVSIAVSHAAETEIVKLNTRGEAVQPYLLMREAGAPKAVVVLVSGGFGLLKFRFAESGLQWEEKSADFLVRNKDRFLDHEMAVAIMDVPSDQIGHGYTPKFRKSAEHIEDLRAVVSDIKTRLPGARLILIGNSQGSTSVAYAGKALGKEVDGVILTASVFDWAPPAWRLLHDANLSDFDFTQIAAPLLIVHHADDRCVATTYVSAAKLAGKYPLITVKGGEAVQDNGCGPLGPHGFLGRETAVVTEIKNWIHGRPHKAEID